MPPVINPTKAEMAILDNVMQAEIDGALNNRPRIWQPRRESKALQSCIDYGWITKAQTKYVGVIIHGYEFTILGHMTYCQACADEGCCDE